MRQHLERQDANEVDAGIMRMAVTFGGVTPKYPGKPACTSRVRAPETSYCTARSAMALVCRMPGRDTSCPPPNRKSRSISKDRRAEEIHACQSGERRIVRWCRDSLIARNSQRADKDGVASHRVAATEIRTAVRQCLGVLGWTNSGVYHLFKLTRMSKTHNFVLLHFLVFDCLRMF